MGIRSQSDKIRKKSKAEEAGSRTGNARPASVSSNQPKVQNFDEWTRAKNAKDFDEWTRIRNGQTDRQPGVSMRQGTKQTSTAESRLAQRRFEATSSRSTEPKTAEDYKRAKQAAEWEQYAADSRAKRLQAIMARTPVQVETENGMEEYKPYTWLNDQLTGEMLTSSEKGAEAARQSDLYWYATQAENRAKASAALGGDKKVDTLLDQYNGKPSTPENADEIRQRLSEVEALMQVTPIQIETENGMVGNPEYTRLVDEQSDLYSRLNGGRLAATSDLQAAGLSTDEIEETAAYRQMLLNEQAQSKRTEFAKRHTGSVVGDIGTSLLSVPANLIGGVLGYADAARQGIGNAIAGNGRPIDWNTDAMALANTANTIRELVSEDLEKKFQAEILGTNVASFLYQTGMSMADSGVIAGLSLIGVPAAASLLSGSAAFSSAQEAKQRGGTDAQALGYGLAAGIAEGLFETVSLEALTENLVGGLSTAAARETGGKKILKILESAGLQMLTEGSEEVATSIANRISDDVIMGDRSSYNTAVREYMASGMSENEAKKKAAEDWLTDLLGDFLGGALSGGIMGGAGTAISASVQGRNEQRMSALPAAEAQAKQETPQDILQRVAMESVQEQASPENTQRIMEQMTETPQQAMERLASEVEPAYNGSINETEVGNNGREDLYLRRSGERNDSQNPRGQVSAVEEDAGRDQSRDVQTRPADGGAASLTYGEKISTKALGIANGSTTGTVRLVKSGETEATRAAAKLAEENGVKLVLFGGGNLHVKNKNGAYVEARGMKIGDTIYCRVDHSRYTAEQLTRHEIGHKWIADGEVNVDAVREKLSERFTTEELDHLAGMYIDAYGSTELTADEVWEEAICDALGFMNIFEGFAEEGDAAVFLVESGRAASEVREEAKAAKEQKFSIEKTIKNEPFVEVEQDILKGVPSGEWVSTVKERLKQKFPNGVAVGNNEIKIDKQSRKEMTFSKYMQWLYKNDPQLGADKLRATNNADEILHATTDWVNEGLKHSRKDKIVDFARGNVLLRVAGNDYTANVVVGMRKNGTMVMYDVLNLQPTTLVKKETDAAITTNPSPGAGRNTAPVSDINIREDSDAVKQDFSRELDNRGKVVSDNRGWHWNDLSYRSYRGDSPMSRAGYAMMADDPHALHAYGDKVVAVRQAELTPIAEFQDKIAENWERDKENGTLLYALEAELGHLSGEEVAAAFDPDDIVDSADAWDNEDMVQWAYEKVFDGVQGVKTSDGAIVFDEELLHSIDPKADVLGDELHGGAREESGKKFSLNTAPLVKPTSDPDIRFSRELDSDGRELTEAQQEYFAESKVRNEDGQLKTVYHGTGADFNTFSYDYMGQHGSMEGQGFYFTDSRSMAGGYQRDGGRVMEGYLNIRKPLSDSEVTLTKAQLKKLIQALDPTGDDVVLNYDPQGGMGYPSKAWYNRSLAATVNAIFDSSDSDSEILADLANSGAGTETVVKTAREVLGYDGYIVQGKYDDADVYVAFESNQFKSVDNTAPTSDPDIRFSRELSIDRLNEENDLLQQTIEGFRESGERPNTVSEQDAEKVARKIIREYSGTITADDISGDVRELSGMIERGDWDAAKEKAMEISQGVVNSALAESEGYAESAELYKEIKKTLRNEKILISREASRDIPDYNQWRKQYFGRLNVKIADGDTGVSGVDAVYERLSGKYPGIFKPGALAESDALLSIADALDKMRPEITNPHSYYMTEATEYCANELINLLAGDRMKQAAPKAAERIGTLASEGRTRTQEALDKLREAYGTIKAGENPSREVAMPKKTSERKHLSQTVRTILESNVTPDVALPTIEQAVLDGDFSYTRYSDKAAIKDAKETVQNEGWSNALGEWMHAANKGIINKKNTAIGWALYDNAVNKGDMETAMNILNKIVTQQRNAAQAVQATRILKKLSPEALLYQVSRSVANIQEELKRRYKDKAPKLKINEEYAEEFLNAKTEKERDAASEKLFRDIGRQVPTTFRDRWNAWRYLAMLMNPRTHIRNIVGNAGFAPVVFVKDLTATGIEKAVSVVSGGRIERSKSPVLTSKAGRALLKEGWSDYNNVADEVSAGKKYSDSAMQNQQVEAGRRIFGNTRFQAWNKTGGRALEAARKGNSYALEAEDVWFSKPHYAYAFAQYSKASGITAEQVRNGTVDEVKLARARAYAIHEAQKATYHDTNDFSEALSKIGRYSGENKVLKGLSVAAEGILPFRKTPANILARGVEYSPLGFLNGLKKAMFDVRKGNSTAAEAIDRISSGLTGTGLLTLGVYLAAQGVVRGLGAGDDDEREFAELQGQQEYSMIIGDQSYTLDWLAPEALPFFVGVNLFEEMQTSGDSVTLASILSTVSRISEPMLSMTCLQGLNAVFESVGYASQEGLSGGVNAIASAATSYLTQALPTILGQIERTAQPSRMTTYTEKNGFLTGDAQYTLGKASSRTPGWDYNQIPYIDAWGRRETTNSLFTRGVNNFLNPAYASTVESSDMEKELERLYGETSSSAVFPSRAAKYFNVDGERVDLTGKQYVTYATWKGQLSYKLMTELVGTDYYKQADDVDKAELVSKVYEYANAVAKTKVSGYKLDGWVEKAADAESYGVSVTEYLRWKTVGTENFSSTAYASAVKSGTAGKVEAELSRLGAAVDSSVFPSAADKKFSVDKQQIELTDSQYAKYAEEKGGLSYQYVAELVGDDFYKAASDKEKGKMVSAVYEYANAVAKTKVSDYALDGWYKKAADAKSYGVSVTQYIWFRSIADADGNGSVTQDEAAEAVRALGLTSRTAKAKLWQSCNEKWKNNPF